MKRQIVVEAVIEPMPQPRQKIGNRRAYLPENHPVHGYKSAIRAAAARVMRGRRPIPDGVPMSVEFVFVMKRPKSYPKSSVATPHILESADCDNLQKAVQDALIGVVYERDGAIWRWSGSKMHAPTGAGASVKITIRF